MKAQHTALVASLLLAVCLVGCGPTDPRERVLEERSRWNVTLLSWAQGADGTLTLNARVSGPVNSDLERLTVRLLLQDAAGNSVDHEWRTLDLSGIQRGGPEDIMLRLAARDVGVEGIGIDTVPTPAPDELPHIVELDL